LPYGKSQSILTGISALLCEFEDSRMIYSLQHDHGFAELDPDLLSTPFRAQTNWHVITGAPSCGKTTLIDQLANQGFQTVPESARLYIEREIAKGRAIHEILASSADERAMTDWQRRVEHGLRATDVAFLDRALPDYLAWWRVHGLNPNELLAECLHHCYASVFMLDPLPFQSDNERVDEVAAVVDYTAGWLARDYGALGYSIVRVPVLPPEERLAFVLERLSEQGLL
jgi:predicted ATPase